MDALLLLIQAVLIFGVAFIYSNLGLGGGLLFVPMLLSTGVPDKDLAVPISLTLTIATATSSVINHHRHGLVDFRLGGVLLAGALLGAVVGTVFTLKVLNQRTFEEFFAAVLIVFGIYMVRDWMKNARSVDEDDDSAMTPPRVAATAAATTGSGFLSSSMFSAGRLGRRSGRRRCSSSRPPRWVSSRTLSISRSGPEASHGPLSSSSFRSSCPSSSQVHTSDRGGASRR